MIPKRYRPKLFQGWTMRAWYLKNKNASELPPESSSVFNEEYATETESNAVEVLLTGISDGSQTVFTEEVLPVVEGVEYSEFLGVYDVTADTGVRTLASPTKITDKYVDGAIVMHYNSETDTWEKVEDVEIVDGYVWATFESLSPVAVYVYRRKMYTKEAHNRSFLVANGLPVTITSSETEGKVVVTDVLGNSIECDSNISIVGGTLDENSVLEETNVVLESGTVKDIIGGSVNYKGEQACVEHVIVTINGGTVTNIVDAGIHKVRVYESDITINDGTVKYVSSGIMSSDSVQGDCNNGVANLESPAYVLDACIVVNGGNVGFVYSGGNSGFGYIKESSCIINNGTFEYVLGPSNGIVEKLNITITDGTFNIVQSVNRGLVKEVLFDISGGTIDKFFLGGDATDTTVNGKVETVNAMITGGVMNLYPGTNAGVSITPTDNIIKNVKVNNGVEVTYMENFQTDFASIIEVV